MKETILAPISGIINQIVSPTGSKVYINELILRIEIMKLFYDVSSSLNGTINLFVSEGEFVQEGQSLGEIIGE